MPPNLISKNPGIGTAILVEQDFADIFLPIAKMLQYAARDESGSYDNGRTCKTLSDIGYAVFALAWIPTRHGVFFWLYHTIWTTFDPKNNVAKYDPSQGAYLSENVLRVYAEPPSRPHPPRTRLRLGAAGARAGRKPSCTHAIESSGVLVLQFRSSGLPSLFSFPPSLCDFPPS